MKSAAQQTPLFSSSLLVSAGITDLSKIVSLSFDLQPQINKRSITYREQTTVYVDDMVAQVRLVVKLKVESKSVGLSESSCRIVTLTYRWRAWWATTL